VSLKWIGLVAAPTIALATQSILYSLVTPECSRQARLEIHLVAAVALVIVLVLAVIAYGESSLHRPEPASPDSDEGHPEVTRRFLLDAAVGVAALSALVILGMWFTTWVLGPCMP
jgi:hypothetical protein